MASGPSGAPRVDRNEIPRSGEGYAEEFPFVGMLVHLAVCCVAHESDAFPTLWVGHPCIFIGATAL